MNSSATQLSTAARRCLDDRLGARAMLGPFNKPSVALCALLLAMLLPSPVLLRSASAQGVTGPSCISPLLCRGLVPDSLSIYATMPDANGVQQVTTSFRVVNVGRTAALPSTTLVQWAGNFTYMPTPGLAAGAAAYFSTTTITTLTDVVIAVTTSNYNTASFHFLSNTTALGRWRPIGPSKIVDGQGVPVGVGRVTTIALDPSSTSIVYAGATNSGLWKTSDGGAHWAPLTDALPSLNIYAVAVDPSDPKYVFITTPAGVFGSTDGGHVWRLLNSSDLQAQGYDGGAFIVRRINNFPSFLGASATVIDPTATSTTTTTNSALIPVSNLITPLSPEIRLYVSTGNGLLISRDGGVTWLAAVLGGPGAIIQSLDQDRANPDHMLATIVNSSALAGMYETFNGGLSVGSWHKVQGCPDAPAPDFSAATVKTQVWATQSGSTEWIFDRTGNNHRLSSTTDERCTVNGFPERGWQLLSSGSSTNCISPDASGFNAEWSYLRADPANSQVLYKAGVKLCRSTDGGSTFQELGGLHFDHHALVFHPAAANVLLDGNDGGLYRSDDGGQSFQFDAEGLANTEFLDVDDGGASPNIVVGGAQDNATSATDLTSPVWRQLPGDADGDRSLVAVDPLDPTVQYTVGQAVDHLSKVKNSLHDISSVWQWDSSQNGTDILDPFNGLPERCIAYDTSPKLFTQFLATSNSTWHLLTTVGAAASGCDGGIWAGPPWKSIWVPSSADPTDTQVLRRLAYDPYNGLFLAGGSAGSIYIALTGDLNLNLMFKAWTAPPIYSCTTNCAYGKVSGIVPDPSLTANYFVSLEFVGDESGSRIFEISPSGLITLFSGQDITANLPKARVITIAANPFESGVLYAGTYGAGVFRGVRDANGNWKWKAINNGMPQAAVVTKLRVAADGTVYAGTYGRGLFALDTVANIIY